LLFFVDSFEETDPVKYPDTQEANKKTPRIPRRDWRPQPNLMTSRWPSRAFSRQLSALELKLAA